MAREHKDRWDESVWLCTCGSAMQNSSDSEARHGRVPALSAWRADKDGTFVGVRSAAVAE